MEERGWRRQDGAGLWIGLWAELWAGPWAGPWAGLLGWAMGWAGGRGMLTSPRVFSNWGSKSLIWRRCLNPLPKSPKTYHFDDFGLRGGFFEF